MDTVTHALTGTAIGYCGFRQRGGRIALWTAIVAAEFPDADIVMAAFGGETYLRWHRSFTHSALLLPFWATVVATIFWSFAKHSNYRLLWLAAFAGIASHLFLDWITSYGTMLLWPITDSRYELSWVFILDPYVWAMLGVTLWFVLRRRSDHAAGVGLAVVATYFLLCGISHYFATQSRDSARVAAFAQPLKPLHWTIVREDGDTVHWTNGARSDTFTQFRDEVWRPQAEATAAVKMFRWFAVFPLVEKLTENGRTVLRYRDLRFRSPMPDGTLREGMFVVAKVVFDEHDHVRTAGLTSEE